MFNPEFLATDNNDGQDGNSLIQYLQEQSPDVLQRVAKSASGDIQDIIRHNVQGLLGMLLGFFHYLTCHIQLVRYTSIQ